jgi:hypothetical protein
MVNVEQLNELMHNRQVLFLSDALCTGYFAADMAEVRLGDDVAVFGAGPVGCSPRLISSANPHVNRPNHLSFVPSIFLAPCSGKTLIDLFNRIRVILLNIFLNT